MTPKPAETTLGRPTIWAEIPDRVEELGIPKTSVVDLILRRLHADGVSSLESLSNALKLPIPVVESLFRELRQQQLLDVKGTIGNDYSFALTGAGRALATERVMVCRYAGPAPVSIDAYHTATRAQGAKVHLDRELLRSAYSDLVVTDRFLDQLGPALISQNSLFLYGPTGNGKTSVAERLLRIYQDTIIVPYAVEVDGHIIVLFDPVVHRQAAVTGMEDLDPRWVVCKRPCITVGGELVPGMLELRMDEASGVYAAPLQMKANNGILLIDDFGRQVMMSPRDLLNRWIVPLDRRVDYLSLRHGVKFQIPFELMVVFSTNLDPNDLADEAFLRRIQNKIYVEEVTAPVFDEIFERILANRKMPADPGSTEHLRAVCARYATTGLRACYPNDICNILISICRYENRPVRITAEDLDRAAQLYFTREQQSGKP